MSSRPRRDAEAAVGNKQQTQRHGCDEAAGDGPVDGVEIVENQRHGRISAKGPRTLERRQQRVAVFLCTIRCDDPAATRWLFGIRFDASSLCTASGRP